MGDQGRWFKLWCSAPSDPAIQALPTALRWAWAALGCYTKLHGRRGVLVINGANPALAAQMGVEVDAVLVTIRQLPNIQIEEGIPSHGSASVTWMNWHKYQEDTTMSLRAHASRTKRRREEKKEEEKKLPPSLEALPTKPTFQIPTSIQDALGRCPKLGEVSALRTPAFWQAELRANPGVRFADELLKAEAWLTANRDRAPRKDLARFLHNWLGRAERAEE